MSELTEYVEAEEPRESLSGGRITIVDRTYCYSPGDQPVVVDSSFSRWLKSSEQPYQRRQKVGEEWTRFDHGWLERSGMMVLANHATTFNVIPTPEERRVADSKILEVGFGDNPEPELLVLPGESLRATPARLGRIWVRCQSGTTTAVLTLLPE